MSSMDTVQEATLFKDCELVYCVEDTGNYHVNKTGYFWLVCELPELKHLLKKGQYTGEADLFGNWSLWTDCLSAVSHWLMRAKFGTADWQTRKDCEKHCLVGFKLDCTRLCNDLICKELGVFNGLYWAHCLTGKNMLQLSETERKTIVALYIKQNPTAMLKETAHWVRHCQLSWDRTGNKPNWVNQENLHPGPLACLRTLSPAPQALQR